MPGLVTPTFPCIKIFGPIWLWKFKVGCMFTLTSHLDKACLGFHWWHPQSSSIDHKQFMLHMFISTDYMPLCRAMHDPRLVASGGSAGVNVSQGSLPASYHCSFLHLLNACLVLGAGLNHLSASGAVYTLTSSHRCRAQHFSGAG